MVFPFGALAPDGRESGHQWHSRGQRFDPAYLHQKQQTARPTPCGLVISKSGYIPSPNEAGEFTVHLLFLLNEVFSRLALELSNFLIITMDIPCPGFEKSRGFFIFSTKGGQTNEII